MDSLNAMCPPQTGACLQQIFCAKLDLHQYSYFGVVPAPFHYFLEKVYISTNKRARRGVRRVQPAKLSWRQAEQQAFDHCERSVANQIKLSDCHDGH